MDVLADAQIVATRTSSTDRVITYSGFAIYCGLLFATASHHESWADEAQSWLLARDSSLYGLWTNLLHYEGTPGLWQTLLHLLIRIGLPYSGLQMVSGALVAAAAGLWMWRAPMPLALRMAIPFTFFLGYQYAVVARSYSLLPVLLFMAACVYGRALKRPWVLSIVLSLLTAVTLHGMILSATIWITLLLAPKQTGDHLFRKLGAPLMLYLFVAIASGVAAWPARNAVFVTNWNLSPQHLLSHSFVMVTESFTGSWFWSGLVLLLSLPFLWRGGGFVMFAVATALLCAAASLIYSQVWHEGAIFLAWLFSMWIAAARIRISAGPVIALVIVVLFQGYWTACSVIYDWKHAYSGSMAAADFLRDQQIPKRGLYAIGYACTAIQPYFASNIFANERGGAKPAYWDWSSANRINEDSGLLRIKQPEYVVVGYKAAFEHELWTDAVLRSGYERMRHFEGNVYWRTYRLEPESYDLYRRSAFLGVSAQR